MATTSTIRPGPRNKPLRGATGSVPHGRTIRQGLAVICVPTRGRPAFRPGRACGVAAHIEAAVRDLAALPPMLRRQLVPSAGTYACRAIAGTARRSMHSYGVAIDIAVRASDYWRWAGGEGAHGD